MKIKRRKALALAQLRNDSPLRHVDARLKLGLVLLVTLSVMLPLDRLLAFGLGLSLVSYYILASFVNYLAALLSLAGLAAFALWLVLTRRLPLRGVE